MALVRSVMLADGENLVLRYQELLKTREPKADVTHIPDKLVWSKAINNLWNTDFYRVSYYTSCVGDEKMLKELCANISAIEFELTGKAQSYYGKIELSPHVYKKRAKSHKSRLVDINICIDAMRYAYTNSAEVICVLSGDGDFINLIKDIKNSGKKVCVGAFSSGLSDELKYISDHFISLDDVFFKAV